MVKLNSLRQQLSNVEEGRVRHGCCQHSQKIAPLIRGAKKDRKEIENSRNKLNFWKQGKVYLSEPVIVILLDR